MSMDDSSRVVIGRGHGCDFQFPDHADDVSRVHAEARWVEQTGWIIVRDLGSVNGTEPARGASKGADGSVRLEPGQSVICGEQEVTFEQLRQTIDQKRATEQAEREAEKTDQRRRQWRIAAAVGFIGLALVALAGGGWWYDRQQLLAEREALEKDMARIEEQANEAQQVVERIEVARDDADELLEKEAIEQSDYEEGRRIGPFLVNAEGTVTDTRTGLMWRRCPLGMHWGDDGCEGMFDSYAWSRGDGDDAYTVREVMRLINSEGGYAGYDDWRMPSIEEMLTLVAEDRGVRHKEAFLNSPPTYYWTASEWGPEETYWVVSFEDGQGYWHEPGWELPILPVREDERARR